MINVTDITYRYGRNKKAVLGCFSLKLEENNIYGLLGKNGAGKSALHQVHDVKQPSGK
jgi:ABC-2 type transport system ATP-binding protein